MSDKFEGFKVEIIMPAPMNKVKLFKKLEKMLPTGTAISMVGTDRKRKDVGNFGDSRVKQEGI